MRSFHCGQATSMAWLGALSFQDCTGGHYFVGQVLYLRPLATSAKGHTAGELGTPCAACSEKKEPPVVPFCDFLQILPVEHVQY
jgi:hypothetical protein